MFERAFRIAALFLLAACAVSCGEGEGEGGGGEAGSGGGGEAGSGGGGEAGSGGGGEGGAGGGGGQAGGGGNGGSGGSGGEPRWACGDGVLTALSDCPEDDPLRLPAPGELRLAVVSPTVLELTLVVRKEPDPAPVPAWDFVDSGGQLRLPDPAGLRLLVAGAEAAVLEVGFRRRALHAPLSRRDLLVKSHLYLVLAQPLAEGAVVELSDPSGALLAAGITASVSNDPWRLSRAIHVDQVGYLPLAPKRAFVGAYLGSLGELPLTPDGPFTLVDDETGASVYEGRLAPRLDQGFSFQPQPYQQVLEARFDDFTIPGSYRVEVPGLGRSYPFPIEDGVGASFARAFALGLYHQRCGGSNELPFTPHTHAACHVPPARVPTMEPEFDFVNRLLGQLAAEAPQDPRRTAPPLSSVDQSLYPFVRQGSVEVRGGHHDAGDYSKYTTNVAALVHALVFTADAVPGAAALDNLGLPESGDGIGDILQEARWEADFLAALQDDDGGFYFLVYPQGRRYESDVLPDAGDPQLVFPKTTAATAAAVGALAEAGSSPAMRAAFPEAAAGWLSRARAGFRFLQDALARHGRDGAYQRITHYGDEFLHDDELAWAAAALFAATGEASFHDELRAHTPDPTDPALKRWGWWGMFDAYGNAFRTYAFAARTGRLPREQLDPAWLAGCEAEVRAAGDAAAARYRASAYGTSLPLESKSYGQVGWYFSSEQSFDLVAAQLIAPSPEYVEAVVGTLGYDGGANPLDQPFVTGLGWKRQREIVHQYAQNDRRPLPPSGILQGSVQTGYQWLDRYGTELSAMSHPSDGAASSAYPPYDRWADTFNVTTEFVVPQLGRALAGAALLVSGTATAGQPFRPAAATIEGLPARAAAGDPITATLAAPGLPLRRARITWQERDAAPSLAPAYRFVPRTAGAHWVEAEAWLGDGRRVAASGAFQVFERATTSIEDFAGVPLADPSVVAWYPLDADFAEGNGRQPELTPAGAAALDRDSFEWAGRAGGGALRVSDVGDRARVTLPGTALYRAGTTAGLSVEAMLYVSRFTAYGRSVSPILALTKNWNSQLVVSQDTWAAGPSIGGGTVALVDAATLDGALARERWVHLRIALDATGYRVTVDGTELSQVPSGELAAWDGDSPVSLEFGGFDGWVDEVLVRSW